MAEITGTGNVSETIKELSQNGAISEEVINIAVKVEAPIAVLKPVDEETIQKPTIVESSSVISEVIQNTLDSNNMLPQECSSKNQSNEIAQNQIGVKSNEQVSNGLKEKSVPSQPQELASSPISEGITQASNSFGSSTSCEASTSKANLSCFEKASSNIIEEEWARREKTLLEKISLMEKQQGDTSIKGLQLQIKVRNEENDILKAKVINLETELNAVLKKPNGKNKDIVGKIKKQHEELLTKARGMIFDKTKMVKNQELQIEALTTQVSSLKEVASITKDLLGIRNMEVKHLQERLECMDMKIQAEKERHNLMAKKIESGTKANELLKNEYETQLALFKELKSRYEEKFRMLEENQKPPSVLPETSQQ